MKVYVNLLKVYGQWQKTSLRLFLKCDQRRDWSLKLVVVISTDVDQVFDGQLARAS